VEIGANVLACREPEKILECYLKVEGKKNSWEQPSGDGKAGEKVVKIVINEIPD